MGLLGCVAAPAVERIIDHHAGIELLEIVGEHARQAERQGKKPARFLDGVELGGIRRAHDGGKPQHRIEGQAEFLNHRIEGAVLAAVAEELTFDGK